ncbi:UNVERIFIED_CONTAM: hypothetical protein PYX00_005771 [Menopon gallinae]|uniref:FHF complex subunit HOOK-interacting protein C-terminal domain-containing protein n=1 Tax=Menopon gallinae TaxID=328185 RepID=A0AAW2HTV2_9NEOP
MSWLLNSQLRTSLGGRRQVTPPLKECDPTACIESFKKHWQQAREIIERTQPPGGYPIHDDVLGVVNHLGQMVTLLVLELRPNERVESSQAPTPCLEHLLSENILERLFNWSIHTGRFINDVKLEQLKLYELFVSHAGQQLLVHEPFLRPLLKLLSSCTSEVYPVEVEKHLVLLLNQLCVSVMHNIQLLDLFFSAPSKQGPAKFLLFSLLVPFVHREGSIGQQARDALLLCMSLSKKNDLVGAYITENSNVCPVLATGLSGLYSLLPRKLEIETEDWHRLTPDDINELPELTHFINSFEFCNAIAQVAHPTVKDQLLEFIYQGFLLPTVEELVTATAYYELFIRNATNSGLLQTLIKFLLKDCYDGQRILNTLIVRIHSPTRLCLVTLALLETLINLDSEEVMVELILKHLVPCSHVMLSQRRRLREIDPYAPSALRFLSLTPLHCSNRTQPVPSHPRASHAPQSLVYGLRPEESLYGNYHAYLCDARSKIESCARNCKKWSRTYDGEDSVLANSVPSRKNSAINKNENCDRTDELPDGDGPSESNNNLDALDDAEDGEGEEDAAEKDESSKNSSNVEKIVRSNSHLDSYVTPDIGPFLDALLKALEKMPFHSLYVNLRLTAIISRLAVYPQPLLSSLLLNHFLVFQPSIRSLFQVLASVKQKLDSILNKTPDVEKLIGEALNFLLQREEKLANMRKIAVEAPAMRRSVSSNEPFSRGDSRRRSFSSALSSVLRRAIPSSPPTIEKLIEVDVPGSVYRYIRSKKTDSNGEGEIRDAVLCAVLLDEWLKELAAIAQEHTLYSLTNFT